MCIYPADVEYLIFKFTKLKICLSGKDIFLLYKNKSVEQNLVINLIIMYGKYHIHKQKLTNDKPNIILLKIELKHYIEALKDARNKKAMDVYYFWIPFFLEFFVMMFPL